MNTWYFTLAIDHGGPGYVAIDAHNWIQARALMFALCGPHWAFQYDDYTDIHPTDRAKCVHHISACEVLLPETTAA